MKPSSSSPGRGVARRGTQAEVQLGASELLERAEAVAKREASKHTQRTYTAAYRGLAAFLSVRCGRPPTAVDLDAAAIVAYRDALIALGRSRSTVEVYLSAVRKLADALHADPAIQRVKAQSPGDPGVPALTLDEYQRLLRMPDRRTIRGARDLAILHLLGDAGLRRSEAAALTMNDVVKRRRQRDGRTWPAIAPSRAERSDYELRIRDAKGGKGRTVPLSRPALHALLAWREHRPAADTLHVFVSLPRNARPASALSPAAVGDVVTKHANAAELLAPKHTAHVLRHTFCTLLAERGTPIDVIAELAGHADIRTTQRYITVTDTRRDQAVSDTFETGRRDWDQARPV